MTENENDALRDMSKRINSMAAWARWTMGGIGVVILGMTADRLLVERRVTVVESAVEQHSRDIVVINDFLRAQDLSGLVQQVENQGQTLRRIDASIAELNRYLRNRTE